MPICANGRRELFMARYRVVQWATGNIGIARFGPCSP